MPVRHKFKPSDVAAVEAVKAKILSDTTLLGVTGVYDRLGVLLEAAKSRTVPLLYLGDSQEIAGAANGYWFKLVSCLSAQYGNTPRIGPVGGSVCGTQTSQPRWCWATKPSNATFSLGTTVGGNSAQYWWPGGQHKPTRVGREGSTDRKIVYALYPRNPMNPIVARRDARWFTWSDDSKVDVVFWFVKNNSNPTLAEMQAIHGEVDPLTTVSAALTATPYSTDEMNGEAHGGTGGTAVNITFADLIAAGLYDGTPAANSPEVCKVTKTIDVPVPAKDNFFITLAITATADYDDKAFEVAGVEFVSRDNVAGLQCVNISEDGFCLEKTDPDYSLLGAHANSGWLFEAYDPEIVVLKLGANDSESLAEVKVFITDTLDWIVARQPTPPLFILLSECPVGLTIDVDGATRRAGLGAMIEEIEAERSDVIAINTMPALEAYGITLDAQNMISPSAGGPSYNEWQAYASIMLPVGETEKVRMIEPASKRVYEFILPAGEYQTGLTEWKTAIVSTLPTDEWVAEAEVEVGDEITAGGYYWKCSTAGECAGIGSEPAWAPATPITGGATIDDGTAKWTKCCWKLDAGYTAWPLDSVASGVWTAATAYSKNDLVIPTGGGNGFCYRATAAGTSHAATEPTWKTVPGQTTDAADGTIAGWECLDTYPLSTSRASRLFRIDAGKVDVSHFSREAADIFAEVEAALILARR